MGNGNRETESSIKGSQSIARASSSLPLEGMDGGEEGKGTLGQRLAGAGVLVLAVTWLIQ